MFPVQFISLCLTNPAFPFRTVSRMGTNLDLFAKTTELPRRVSRCHLHTQTVRVAVFEQDVPLLKKSLRKAHTFKMNFWKSSSELKQTLCWRREHLMSSGSRGSPLAQHVKTNGLKPGIQLSSSTISSPSSMSHLKEKRLGLCPQLSVFSCYPSLLEWLFQAREGTVRVQVVGSDCNVDQAPGR